MTVWLGQELASALGLPASAGGEDGRELPGSGDAEDPALRDNAPPMLYANNAAGLLAVGHRRITLPSRKPAIILFNQSAPAKILLLEIRALVPRIVFFFAFWARLASFSFVWASFGL